MVVADDQFPVRALDAVELDPRVADELAPIGDGGLDGRELHEVVLAFLRPIDDQQHKPDWLQFIPPRIDRPREKSIEGPARNLSLNCSASNALRAKRESATILQGAAPCRQMAVEGLDSASPEEQNRERRWPMRTAALILTAAFSILPAAPALADAPPPGEEIVVQGARPAQKEIRSFVKALTAGPSWAQVGRFHSAVCPVAMGLPAAQNARIAARMRQVAAVAGMKVGKAKCAPNAFVIVAPDKRTAVAELSRRFPAYVTGVSDQQLRRLAADPAPAVAWQVKSLRSGDGELLEKPAGYDYLRVEGTYNVSRIRSASMPTFVASMLVIDRRSVGGLTVTQLADYAAMRTFADTDPGRLVGSAASILPILTLPADAPLPETLTHWDLALLKALYSTSNTYYAGYQRGDMEQVVKKELEAAGKERP